MPSAPLLTHEAVLAWLAAHDEAWRSNDPDAIGRLFSEDGIYHLGPWEGPWRGYTGPIVGRRAIAEVWTSTFDRDERFEADEEVVAVEGRRGVVRRTIAYRSAAGRPATRYGSIWVLDFDDDGCCHEYQEWYVREPASEPSD